MFFGGYLQAKNFARILRYRPSRQRLWTDANLKGRLRRNVFILIKKVELKRFTSKLWNILLINTCHDLTPVSLRVHKKNKRTHTLEWSTALVWQSNLSCMTNWTNHSSKTVSYLTESFIRLKQRLFYEDLPRSSLNSKEKLL